MKRISKLHLSCFFLSWFLLCAGCQTAEPSRSFDHDGRRIIAYWHNWNSLSVPYIPLREVPPAVNTLILAFALPMDEGSTRMNFVPEVVEEGAFEKELKALQNRGTDVLISVGGGNHPIELDTPKMTLDFLVSMKRLIDRYGFDGLDINFEGSSKVLDDGDLDFRNPTTPKILNLIKVVKSLKATYGSDFLITVAPETQFTVSGYHKYGGAFGGYLPLLHALRDEIDVVNLQLYNSGTQYVYTGTVLGSEDPIVAQGTPDFVVGLTEMMIMGFPVGRDEDQFFPGMGAEKIAVGLPASELSASGGVLSYRELRLALGYLMTGKANYDSDLVLRTREGYPDLKGIMTWSINWDRVPGPGRPPFAFVEGAQEIIETLTPLK